MLTKISGRALQADQPSIDRSLNLCRICRSFVEPRRERWNEPLKQTANFIVLPSLGSLVPGWLLVFPRDHRRAIADCSQSELGELRELRRELQASLSDAFSSPVVQFEHGAVCGGEVGCGVFHAHLHLVPTDHDLLGSGRRWSPHLEWRDIADLDSVWQMTQTTDYLAIEQAGLAALTNSHQIPSQFFRRVLAKAIGRQDDWNWKTDTGIEMIERTIAGLTIS